MASLRSITEALWWQRLLGTSLADRALYTSQDHVLGAYVRNPTSWTGDWDLTCVSPWCETFGPTHNRVTAITPLFGIAAVHSGGLAGASMLRFVTAANVMIFRGVQAVETIYSINGAFDTDIQLVQLFNPLPATIKPAKFFPADWRDHIDRGLDDNASSARGSRFPAFFVDAEQKAVPVSMRWIDETSSSRQVFRVHANAADYTGWWETPVDGDSGGPVGTMVGSDYCLIGSFNTTGSGASALGEMAKIEERMTAMAGTPTTVTRVAF